MTRTRSCTPPPIEQAQRLILDVELKSGAADENVSKGMDPVPAITLREAPIVERRFGVVAARTNRGAREWMQLWRHRRGLTLRKFPAIEPLEEKDMHGKASARIDAKKSISRFHFFWPPMSAWGKRRPFFGPAFETA